MKKLTSKDIGYYQLAAAVLYNDPTSDPELKQLLLEKYGEIVKINV